jgi:hypothetical protein
MDGVALPEARSLPPHNPTKQLVEKGRRFLGIFDRDIDVFECRYLHDDALSLRLNYLQVTTST